ncbi:MAG: MBL fold metallo-hydrolase, partial [Ardenticatenaceae bacterium]
MEIANKLEQPIQILLPTPLQVGTVNAWLLRGAEPALVDVGPRAEMSWEALVAGLAVHGLALSDLRHVFITHAHVDHYGNAARLAEAAPDAIFYAPDLAHARPTLLDLDEEWERHLTFTGLALRASGVPEELVQQGRTNHGFLRGLASAVPVARWVHPGERLWFGEGSLWEVVALPGHSMTQVGLRQVEVSFLIAADHLLPRI